jgi:NitT/TauT family transport system permease protein
MKKIKGILAQIAPLVIFLSLWEFFTSNSDRVTFLFSRPSKIATTLIDKISNGELVLHFGVTAFEAFAGLVLGVLIGSIIGFLLLYFPKASKISKYYVIALSSIPIFAIAPMMIIWFGIGIEMKIAMAFFSTVFVAIFQAYQGGQNVNKRDAEFFKLNGASDKQLFWKLTFPSSIDWLIQSLKLNSGLAVLGAFIGEFISAEKGLGYIIIKASGLYNVSYVLAATVCIVLLATIFNYGAILAEKNKLKIIRKISARQKRLHIV